MAKAVCERKGKKSTLHGHVDNGVFKYTNMNLSVSLWNENGTWWMCVYVPKQDEQVYKMDAVEIEY